MDDPPPRSNQSPPPKPSTSPADTSERVVFRGPAAIEARDHVVIEEPLEIRVEDRSLAITMRTPGHDRELAAGFLLTEGVIDGAEDLTAIGGLPGDRQQNTIVARVAGGVQAHLEAIERASRELFATSACGVCGKVSLDRLQILARSPIQPLEPDPAVLARLPDALRDAQPTFRRTGGLHAAALVTPDGVLEVVREDIGRHNAADKVLGWRVLRDQVPVSDRILLVSGRAGFEIVQKARVAGVPVVAAIGAASSLAVDLASSSGIVLIGFLRPDRWTRYA
ncbi:MAG TPA: formate dehydrogenase accessory sulfurtransferase FdhD [Deltaproteobacteria bacterium]|nr:formate dehydrogenase accessory sulfurtransferase FdhD [Deltaproteobacteria bacterium]